MSVLRNLGWRKPPREVLSRYGVLRELLAKWILVWPDWWRWILVRSLPGVGRVWLLWVLQLGLRVVIRGMGCVLLVGTGLVSVIRLLVLTLRHILLGWSTREGTAYSVWMDRVLD